MPSAFGYLRDQIQGPSGSVTSPITLISKRNEAVKSKAVYNHWNQGVVIVQGLLEIFQGIYLCLSFIINERALYDPSV